MASASEVGRYRTGVANLLKKQVGVMSETEGAGGGLPVVRTRSNRRGSTSRAVQLQVRRRRHRVRPGAWVASRWHLRRTLPHSSALTAAVAVRSTSMSSSSVEARRRISCNLLRTSLALSSQRLFVAVQVRHQGVSLLVSSILGAQEKPTRPREVPRRRSPAAPFCMHEQVNIELLGQPLYGGPPK